MEITKSWILVQCLIAKVVSLMIIRETQFFFLLKSRHLITRQTFPLSGIIVCFCFQQFILDAWIMLNYKASAFLSHARDAAWRRSSGFVIAYQTNYYIGLLFSICRCSVLHQIVVHTFIDD